MPQLTLFGKPAAQSTAGSIAAAKRLLASKAASRAPKVSKGKTKTKALASSQARAEGTAELDSAARAQAAWAAHRTSQITGVALTSAARVVHNQPSPPQAAEGGSTGGHHERLLGISAPTAGGSTTLAKMQAQERLLVDKHGGALRSPGIPPAAPKTTSTEAGWRRMRDGERTFVTASGKRLTGKVAHAAAKRLKS